MMGCFCLHGELRYVIQFSPGMSANRPVGFPGEYAERSIFLMYSGVSQQVPQSFRVRFSDPVPSATQ